MDKLVLHMEHALMQLQIIITNYETSLILAKADELESNNNRDVGLSRLFAGITTLEIEPKSIEDDLRVAAILSLGPHHNFHELETEAQWAKLGRCLALEKLGCFASEIGPCLHPNMNKKGKTKVECETFPFRRAVLLSVFREDGFFDDLSKEGVFQLFSDKNIALSPTAEEAKRVPGIKWIDKVGLHSKSYARPN